MTTDLRKYLALLLEDCDEAFATQGVRLKDRALQAAMAFVSHFVVDVPSGSKDAPFGEPWFDYIYFEVSRWYALKYRNALSTNSEGTARALVAFRGAPLPLSVPLTVSRPSEHTGHVWLHFPNGVRDDEDALSFLDLKVDLSAFRADQVEALRADCSTVVTKTRSMYTWLATAELSKEVRSVASRILPTFAQGIQAAVADDRERHGAVIWEFNFAAELTLKVFQSQKGTKPEPIHDVRKLYDAALALGLPTVGEGVINAFPPSSVAIRHRHSEELPPSYRQILSLYDATLTLANHVSRHMSRTITMNNAAMELRTLGTLAREV